jgi:2-polyprenyl-6-methoxyphenol hydroxylase-like FAD-dependent oxidoreductase
MGDLLRHLGERAVIAGGSLAGLLSARVLSDYFDEVLVLDRDELPDEPANRHMTPQCHHVHILLKGGEMATEELIPGFTDEMMHVGSVPLRAGRDIIQGSALGFAPRWDGPLTLHSQSRALLEHCVRKLVRDFSDRIVIRDQTTVRALQYDSKRKRIVGVEAETADGTREEIAADLVIDATGGGAGAMRWLSALKLTVPEVEEVKVNFGYSSAIFEFTNDRDWKGALIGGPPPKVSRGGLALPIENGCYIVSVGGRFGDYPPDDLEGFIQFTKELPQPHLYEAIESAKPCSDVKTMRFGVNRFRHYERMADLVEGLIPIGDALECVNPTYGQGMSSTAKQVKALSEVLAAHGDRETSLAEIAREYLPRAAEVATVPWRQANFNDFMYPQTEGDRSQFTPEEAEYRMKLQMLSMKDDDVRLRLLKVGQMIEPPSILFEDEVAAKVAAME